MSAIYTLIDLLWQFMLLFFIDFRRIKNLRIILFENRIQIYYYIVKLFFIKISDSHSVSNKMEQSDKWQEIMALWSL